jgi:hypothetical protein
VNARQSARERGAARPKLPLASSLAVRRGERIAELEGTPRIGSANRLPGSAATGSRMGRSRAPRPLPCGAPESLARVQLGRGSDARRAAVAARHPDRTPLQPSETPDGRRSCAWTAPLFRPLLQQVGLGTVFRKAGCKDPSGSEACEGRSTRLHAPGVGQSEGTSPHRSEGPPPSLIEADRWGHRAHRSGGCRPTRCDCAVDALPA